MLTAQQLADTLRQQAGDQGPLRIDDALLGIKGFSDLVKRELQRADGVLQLNVDAKSIPASPPAGGFTISGAQVPAGAAGFLNLDLCAASIAFAFGATIEVTLTLQPQQARTWTLGASYPELAFQLYDQLQLSGTTLVLASAQPDQGLSLSSSLAPDGILRSLADLLGLKLALPLQGGIRRGDEQQLALELDAVMTMSSFGIDNFLTLEKPRLVVLYKQTKAADGSTLKWSEIALAATITAGAAGAPATPVVLDVSLALPLDDPDSPLIQLAVMPRDFSASLLSLGSLVGGQSWNDFFNGPAQELKPYFETFGFIGYTMTLTTKAQVNALTLVVGTLKPWTLWGSYTLSLRATWDLTFLRPGTVQTLLLHAGFDYDGKMQFDVDVYLPSLRITGRQSGAPVTLSLADVSKRLFDGGLSIPDDLLVVSVANFWIEIDKTEKQFSIGAIASASFSLFGTRLLSIENMAISVAVDASGPKKVYSAVLDGIIGLGPIRARVGAALSTDPKVGCTFTVHLVDETVGTMLGHLVRLVDPTYNVSFGAPWDKLLDISLDALVLKVDITNKKVEIDYVKTIDLGFLKLTQLGISWQKNANGPSTTKITLSGNLLGVEFGGASGKPALAWDPVNENPPALPGGGDKLLDLRYVGIGQHVGFSPDWRPANVEAVIAKLEQLALPAGGSNLPALTSADGLRFRNDSSWLVGADFTVLGTVSLAFVFNDPELYGILISLSGGRAKSFAGLKFEILYRKVTDTIGVYHIELQLPDAMRQLEFGAVSLTLPQVIIDIYSNGNFRINLGFPKGLDFKNSFCLQVFPFLGYGGFYFALLDGDTSTRVPRISNGRFAPVIEFGIALSLGVGKTIDKGILSGGISVVVIGIVEGVIGWFNPNDAAVAKGEYYWLQGTISIVGRMYGTIDFSIIQATLSVTAYASVTLIIEAHQPILISMSVGVSVEVSIKIVFFTIHCSFSTTVSAAFSIGSASATPWVLAGSGTAPARLQLFANDWGVHAPQQRMHAEFARMARRELIQRRLDGGDIALDWTVQTVFATPRAVTLHAMPAFTKANNGVAGIMLLGIQNGIPARAANLRAHALASVGGSADGIGDVLEGLVRWAILNARASLGEQDTTLVSHDDVVLLARAFADDATLAKALGYDGFLNRFLGLNYRFTIAAPAMQTNGDDTGVALFPMPPVLSMTTGTNAPLDFGSYNALDALTLEKMRAYFALLAVDYEKFVAPDGAAATAMPRAEAPTPMAQAVFEQYFTMLMRSVVKAAGDLMQSLPFSMDAAADAFGIAQVRAALGDPGLPALNVISPNRANAALLAQGSRVSLAGVQHQVALGDSFASVAAIFNKVLPADAQLTAGQLAQQNAANAAVLSAGATVSFDGLGWTSLAGECVNLIVTRLLVRAAPQSFLQQLPSLQTQAQALYDANPGVFPPTLDPIAALRSPIDPHSVPQLAMPPRSPFGPYATVAGDTFISVAATLIGLAGTLIDTAGAAAWVIAHNTVPQNDPAAPLPIGTALTLPPVQHTLLAGDSIASLAVSLMTSPETITAALLALPAASNLLAPQAMLALPTLSYAVREQDNFTGIAALFNLSLDGLAAALDAADTPVFAAGARILVADAEQMTVDRLVTALAATQWRTIAPMASRFMLAGLRLPDPADAAFRNLTLAQMRDPHALGAIATLPMYVQTGQQFALTPPLADDYGFVLAPNGQASWIVNAGPLTFPLNADQRDVISAIGGASFAPPVALAALPLFRLAPTRYTLQQHLAWQPARLPGDAVYAPALAGSVTGSPDIWMFPDALADQLQTDGPRQPPYALSIGSHESAGAGMQVRSAKAYAWATAVRFGVQQLDGAAAASASGASTMTVTGVDDAGLALLEAVLAQLAHDDATLFLLYSPNPASTASGLFSDDLGLPTALVQTNLSTLSHSSAPRRSAFLLDQVTGEPTYVAPLTQASAFVQMLRECSIVRSGGYYLRYAAPDGVLPPTLFSKGPEAELLLLIVLKSQNAAHAAMLPFNNCAIAGDNLDPGACNVFVQPATWLVPGQRSLADAQAYARQTFGLALDAAGVATLNADVPQLLRPGATVALPNGADTVRLGDTLATLAARNQLTPATLAAFGGNASAALLTPGGLLQFSAGALSRTPAIAAGNAGFQLHRPNPDPGNQLKASAMDGDTIVAELFHMLAQRVVPNATGPAGFYLSGAAVPTGPAQSLPTENGANQPTDIPNDAWDYNQAVAIAPFALAAHGSRSPALPPLAGSPYAGVAPQASVTLAFEFADPYGNTMPMPQNAQTLNQPVRYFDELVGMARWPSAALSYTFGGDGSGDPSLLLALSMQLDKYSVAPNVSVDSAQRNAKTDLATYTRVYYQLAQPDVAFTLSTTLEAQLAHKLDRSGINTFVMSAWTVLDALCATSGAQVNAKGGEKLGDIAALYAQSAASLFQANGTTLYSQLFGDATLEVPQLYTCVAADTLAGIAKARDIDAALLADQNAWALLDPSNDLLAPPRQLTPMANDTLATLASAHQCSVSALATANPDAALTDNLAIAVAGATVTTHQDSFATLVSKFAALDRIVSADQIAIANQNIAGLFLTPVTLAVDDVVPTALDSLATLAQRFGFAIGTLASDNANLPNLFAPGTALYIGKHQASAPAAGTTLAHFASNQGVPLAALGLALWQGLQAASSINADATLAPNAVLAIPATIVNEGQDRHAVYLSQPTDIDLATIAAKFAGNDASLLGTLNVDLPGLILAGAPVRDAASGATVTSNADSTFATLVAAFAQDKHTVTPASLARDNATTAQLVRPGACWITPPMVAAAQTDTLNHIATRFAGSAEQVARLNAGVLGFLAPGVTLPSFAGIVHTTGACDTFNALIERYTLPGAPAPTIEALSAAFADVAVIAAGALILPPPLAWSAAVPIAPTLADPIVALKVAITEARDSELVADEMRGVAGIGSATLELTPKAIGQEGPLALDAFATAVETALPGMRVATGATDAESDSRGPQTLWIVNFGNPRGPAIGYRFGAAPSVRSFAIPPLWTSLVSGQVKVRPYASGTGLAADALPLVFSGSDLDILGATFLQAMDRMLSPDYAVPAQEISLPGFDLIVNAKRTLASAIAGRVQYVLDGQGPGQYGQADPRRADAVTAIEQSLLQQLSSAYTIQGVVQASVDVTSPYADPLLAPRLSGRAKLTQPAAAARLNSASLSTAKVALVGGGTPVPASFLLSLQAPASARSAEVNLAYEIAQIERPTALPDANGYQSSTWLTLIHALDSAAGDIDGVVLPIPLRAYPLPPTLIAQTATASYPAPQSGNELVRWDADAIWTHQDADQDQCALRLEIGTVTADVLEGEAQGGNVDALFAALAQFNSVWPALSADAELLSAHRCGAPPIAATTAAIAAFATMATAVASAWPRTATVTPPRLRSMDTAGTEIVPGSYAYTLTPAAVNGPDLSTLTVDAGAANPVPLWPALAVDASGGGTMVPLTLQSSTPTQAVYAYPAGVTRGSALRYQASVARLDAVLVPDYKLGAAVVRNADLIEKVKTNPLFVYRTPFTAFPSPLIPLLQVEEDFDIGAGTIAQLEAALRTFLQSLLVRETATGNLQRTLRVALNYGYELAGLSGSVAAVRGARSAHAAGVAAFVPLLPIAVVPSISLTINGDHQASIDAFAKELAAFVATWDAQTQPSHTNAALFFDVSLFSANADSSDKPLMTARSVRYALTGS